MHGLVALDAAGRVLRPAILWNDGAPGGVRGDRGALGLERLVELTGNRALAGFTAPKLLWLRRARAGALGAHRARAAAQGLRALKLTGEHAIDVADASGTLLFDVARAAW